MPDVSDSKNGKKTDNWYIVLGQIHDMWALSLFVDLEVDDGGQIRALWKWPATAKAPQLPTVLFRENPEPVPEGSFYAGDVIYFLKHSTALPDSLVGVVGSKAMLRFPTPHGGSSAPMESRRMSQLIPFARLSKACRDQDVPFYTKSVREWRWNWNLHARSSRPSSSAK